MPSVGGRAEVGRGCASNRPRTVFESPHELRVCWRRNGGKLAAASFTVYRQHSSQRELKSAPVTPRSDSVCEARRLGAALHPDSGKSVGHETLAEPGVDRPEHQVGVRGPDECRGPLSDSSLTIEGRDPQTATPSNSQIWGSHAQGKPANGPGVGRGIVEGAVQLYAPSGLSSQAGGYHQIG